MSLGKIIDKKNNDLSQRIDKQRVPEHVAIIMDGNGRWATNKGLPRTYGHERGVDVLKEILKASKKLGCKVLTVYAFSTENWTRPIEEVDFLINLFATDTPLHDGAVLVKGNKIISAGVILPLSRQGISRYGTRHLAALGITERFDRCICIVVSEETGTLSLANQGKLERPITSSRLQELLINLIGNQNSLGANKSSLSKNASSPKTNSSDNMISEINEKETENSEIFVNKKD